MHGDKLSVYLDGGGVMIWGAFKWHTTGPLTQGHNAHALKPEMFVHS